MKKINIFIVSLSFLIMSTAASGGQKLVMVFGCFDLFHEGHKSFLQQAASYGKVIAVVSRDCIIEKLKKRSPDQSEEFRLKQVQESHLVAIALLGDEIMGTYAILKEYKPDIICLGYDQQGLFKDLYTRMNNGQLPQIAMMHLEPYQEEIYHTSLIREKN